MKFEGPLREYIELNSDLNALKRKIIEQKGNYAFYLLWNKSEGSKIKVNSVPYNLKKDVIVAFTSFQEVEIEALKDFEVLTYNKPFLCVVSEDSDVGCKGLLYFGSFDLPVIEMDDKLKLQINLEIDELKEKYKRQLNIHEVDRGKIDLVREFSYLVEMHFKQHHAVSDYANLMNKSPKTITNVFSKVARMSPLNYIQKRIMQEARFLLINSELEISQVGYKLGFNDVQSFSRFFKRHEEMSPSTFRNNLQLSA
jgi:AraC family transcriptional activator of pobA